MFTVTPVLRESNSLPTVYEGHSVSQWMYWNVIYFIGFSKQQI